MLMSRWPLPRSELRRQIWKKQSWISLTHKVIAPTNGRVSRNYVDIGNLVGAKDKTLLTEIVNDSSVYVYFDVSERDLLMLMRKCPKIEGEATSDREKAPAYLQLADETGYPHTGKMDFVESRVDPSTGTLRVRAIFLNDKGMLVPGSSVAFEFP